MDDRPLPQVRIIALEPTACGALPWRVRGELSVAIVVKASFTLVQDGEMRLAPAEPLFRSEVHHGDNPTWSVRATSDLVPYLPQADVVLTGHACAPGGRFVPRQVVRLALHRGQALIDKTLHVYGDRSGGNPAPFQRLPLMYERAFGGIGWDANPLGVGAEPGSRGKVLPNIERPGAPEQSDGFGPISRAWPARRRLLGGLDRKALDRAVLDLPDAFDWTYFQAAPADQRAPYLVGDEWVVLQGVHPDLPYLQSCLPGARAEARVYALGAGAGESPAPLRFRADMLRIDADALRCSVTWRASVPVASEAALGRMLVVAGVGVRGQPIAWPSLEDLAAHEGLKAAAPGAPDDAVDWATTLVLAGRGEQEVSVHTLTIDDAAAAGPPPSMPFPRGAPPLDAEDAPAPIPGAPWSGVPAPRAPAAILAGETLTLGPSAPAEPVAPAAAFFHAAPRAAAEAAAEVIPRRRARLVPFAFDAPLSGLTVAWQVQPPRDAIAVVIKGSFDLVHGGRARLRAEPDAPAGDVHLGDDPRASVLYPSDFAILKPRADVTLAGHAYPPAGGGRTAHARFRFGREGAGFDRSVAVIGDRSFRDGRASPPRPFSRMPLVYERAYGGPDFDRNPVGLGRLAAADGSVRLPNLEDPRHLLRSPADAPPPLCFCGVPMLWRARWSKIGTYDEAWVRRRWPWFPEDFDWSFFQAAPPEQQVDRIAGDEPFLLAGMHPELPVIEGELPHLDVRCFAQRTTEGGGAFHEIPVRLDTVAFDADAMKIGLVWRGLIEVRDDDAPEIAELFVMTGELGGPRATLEEARDRLAAIKAARAPVVDPVAAPEAPANDAAPAGGEGEGEGEGGRVDALDAEIEAHAARVRAQLAAAGVALPAEGDPDPAPPPMDPRKLVEQMRAAGASAEDVAAMEDALRPEPEEGAGAGAATGAGSGGPGPAVLRAEVVARLEAGEPLAGMDLAGADLSGLDLSGRSLAGANLKEARLAGCRLARADLAGAQIGRADLTDAILDAADLTGADLYGATLAGARFAGAKVGGADFSQAAGQGADFKDAAGAQARFAGGDWARAGFVGARLPAADFTGARLDDVLFDGADLPEVRLFDARGARASFAGARMEAARADGACFTRSSFKGAVAPRSLWEQAVLDGSSFLGATLTGAGFVRASCREASFAGADLVEGRFRKADLAGASLLKANLMKASLEAADLSGADLRAANLHGAELWKARLSGAQRELAILTRTKLERRS